jgi:PST family polysaccharide transporter
MFHASMMHIALGLLALGLVFVFGQRLAPLVGAPTLIRYLPGLVLVFAAERFLFMPERILVRQMKFGSLAVLRGAGELAYTVVSLSTAYLGWGAMAVVAGNFARTGVRAIGLATQVSWREWAQPTRLRGSVFRDISAFGSVIYLGALAVFASRRWDNLVVSSLYGPAVMGAYGLAYSLADIPAVQIGEQVTDVLQAGLARSAAGNRQAALLKSIPLIALVMVPLAVGLGVIGPTLAEVFFDKRWTGVGPMLLVLAAISFPRPISGAVAGYLQVKLKQSVVAIGEIITLALLMGALLTVGRLGPLWACATVGVVFTARLPLNAWMLNKYDQISPRRFLTPLIAPLGCAVPLIGAVLLTRAGLRRIGIEHGVVRLMAEVTSGAIGYLVAALVVARRPMFELISLLKSALGRRG